MIPHIANSISNEICGVIPLSHKKLNVNSGMNPTRYNLPGMERAG